MLHLKGQVSLNPQSHQCLPKNFWRMISCTLWQRTLCRFQSTLILWASIQNPIYFPAYTLWSIQMLLPLCHKSMTYAGGISMSHFSSSSMVVSTIASFAGVGYHKPHSNKAVVLIAICFQNLGIWILLSQGTGVLPNCALKELQTFSKMLLKPSDTFCRHRYLFTRKCWSFFFLALCPLD